MKTLTNLLKVLFILIFSSLSYSAEYSCDGESVALINGATSDAYKAYSSTDEYVGDGGSRYFKFKTSKGGEINIERYVTNWNGGYKNHALTIGTSCEGVDIYNGDTAGHRNSRTDTTTFTVVANTTYYVRVQEKNTKSYLNFDIKFDFKADTTPTSCPGDIIPNLDGTSTSATNSFNNIDIPPYTTYYYYFTPTEAGTIKVNSSANKSYNSLFIKDGCGGNLWSDTDDSNNKSSSEVAVSANQTIVIAFERRWDSVIRVDLDFTYTVTVNQPPVANAGADQTVTQGTSVTLDGSNSSDDGGASNLTYSWSNGSTGVTPNIGALPIGSHTFTLTVTDAQGLFSRDTVIIKVIAPPVANAGADQTVKQGTSITLDGSASTGDGLSYQWKEGGTTLSTNSSFTKNDFTAGTHTITLTVTDSAGATSSDDVIIKLSPLPIANAGADQNAVSKTNITLDGSASSGVEPLIYKWEEGSTTLSTDISFSKDDFSVGTHTIKLTVTDANGDSDTDSVIVEITPLPVDVCPGFVIPNLDGTGASATDSFTDVTVLGSATYYYYFTPTIAGTIQTNSSVGGGKYSNSLFIKDGCGANLWSDERDSTSKSSPEIAVRANQTIVIAFERRYTTTLNLDIDFTYTVSVPTPPVISPIPDQEALVGTPFTLDISSFVTEADGDDINYTITSSLGLPPGLALNRVTGVIEGTPTSAGTYNIILSANDKDGVDSEAFTIEVTVPELRAVPDTFDVSSGVTVTGNVLTNDSGLYIKVTGKTSPAYGTLVLYSDGSFTYTPTGGAMNDTFTYTITDSLGHSATALVSINISTVYRVGNQDFVLINPPETRNIIGGYTILGNTIECITNSRDAYTGTCQNSNSYNDNNYMAKYLDIDGNTGIGATTWNSSSSNFTIPTNYDQLDGKGILWAGVFWQGSINNKNSYPQRRAFLDGNGYSFKNITHDENIDLTQTDGNKLLIRVDDDSSYTPLQASTFYYDTAHGTKGGYYAAYTDITALMQSKNLAAGKHTVTIANITANEGRQSGTGNYAGWSMVVIYKQDDLTGDATNVSIYNGYTVIDSSHAQQVTISGFRLPSGGDVHAQFSTFAGEGEFVYKRDRMVMKSSPNGTTDNMPGATDSDNIFDAILANIDRDSGNFNDVSNTNGVDVDTYDVSSIITKYRDNDPYIGTIYIALDSTQDYITPSMMAFSTALYQPNICYDYTVDIGGFIIPSEDNKIKTNLGGYNTPLTTKVSILSKEGDFALNDVNISYRVNDTQQIQYVTGSTGLAPNNRHSYEPAGPGGLNQTYGENPAGFGMYIGTGAGTVPGGPGGIIDSYEARYLKFDTRMVQSSVDTSFKLWIEYTVDYGSGPLHLSKGFGAASICPAEGVYQPAWGIFNVSSDQANNNTGEPYNLYTQISNRVFGAKLFSYGADYTTPKTVDATVEVEVFNAGILNRDTNVSCNNPDSNISAPMFIRFNNTSVTPITNLRYDLAIQNTGFRTWFLTSPSGGFVTQNCTSRNDEVCFRAVYEREYPDDINCSTQCSNAGSGCYACLRKYYGRILCSRDNFSIRPEAFATKLIDRNQNSNTLATSVVIDDSAKSATNTPTPLAADYNYNFDTVATNYRNDNPVQGYIESFNQNISAISALFWNPPNGKDVTGCVDTNNSNISMELFDGSNTVDSNSSMDKINQVGRYLFSIVDSNWTVVDWDPTLLTHHASSGFSQNTDCIVDSGVVLREGILGRHGCAISSNHTHPEGRVYRDLDLEFYPYSFNIDGINQGARPSQVDIDNEFVYINTLSNALYPNGVDENMSYNINGPFFATGYNGARLTNFVNSCYAQNVDMTLRYQYLSSIPADTPALTYDLIEYGSNSGLVTRAREQNANTSTVPTPNSVNAPNSLIIRQLPADFGDTNGSIIMDLGLNFDRRDTTPLNPRLINFIDFNLTFKTQPNLNVDLVNNHLIFADKILNRNISFFYAKIKPSKEFYEDVTQATMITPISIVNYCDLGIVECQNRNIDTFNGQTNETSWWLSTSHRTLQQDGNIALTIDPITEGVGSTPSVNPINVVILGAGIDNSIVVNRGLAPVLPLTVPISLDRNTSMPNYTDRWLFHDPFANITPLDPLYRVRFLGDSNWGGFGERGNVVETSAGNQKTKRLDW